MVILSLEGSLTNIRICLLAIYHVLEAGNSKSWLRSNGYCTEMVILDVIFVCMHCYVYLLTK